MGRAKTLLAELRRRKVYSVAAAYVVTGWVMAMGAAELFPYFGIPDWAVRLVVASAILGFPVAIVLAWAFEVTPEGVVRDSDARAMNVPAEIDETIAVAARSITAVLGSGEDAQQFTFNTGFIIGRDESSDLCIDDTRVSREHARVYFEDDHWWIRDLASRNGTFINGESITQDRLTGTSSVLLARDGPSLTFMISSGITTVPVD